MDKKIKRFATTTIICVLVASIFGTVMVLAPPPDGVFPQLINVFITNTSDDPVPVDITDDTLDVTLDEPIEVITTPDFEPVQFVKAFTLPDGGAGVIMDFFEVPEGKMLVIEYISAEAMGIGVSDSLSIGVGTTVNGVTLGHVLGLFEPQGRSRQFLFKEVKFYADPETSVSVGVDRLTQLNDVFVRVVASGYFIDVS